MDSWGGKAGEHDIVGADAYARKLVQAFGAQVFDVIEAEPHPLREVAGIGPKRADDIARVGRAAGDLRDHDLPACQWGWHIARGADL